MKMEYEIVGGSNVGVSTDVDTQRSINMYPHFDQKNGKKVMLPRQGLVKQITGSYSPMRAEYVFEDDLYAVLGDRVVKYDAGFTESVISTPALTTSSGYVGISSNNASQMIVIDGVKGYIWDSVGTSWTEITAPGFPSQPTDVAFLDGYFITFKGDSNEFDISTLNDGTSWDALRNFAYLQSRPDKIVAIRVLERRLFIFGRYNTEIWTNVGGSDFPFARSQNESMEFGCAAIGSIKRGFGRLFWLARDENGTASVMMSTGTIPKPVSTIAIDYKISQWTNPENARAILYKENGHIFYELSSTESNETLVLDVSMNEWVEASELDHGRSRVDSQTVFLNKNYVGNYQTGDIYYFDATHYFNDEDNIRRLRIGTEIKDENGLKFRINSLELQVKSGIGTATGDSEDPIIYFSFSKDGGVSYGGRVPAKIGKIGERRHRVIWRNLGTAYSFTPKFEYFQDGQFIITKMVVNYDLLR